MTEPAEASARKGALAGLGTIGIIVTGILTAVGLNEGGYVVHPNDPGGATNEGVTEEVACADGFTGLLKDFPKEGANDSIVKGYIKEERKSVVEGKMGSVRVDSGGRRIMKKKKKDSRRR